jgi:hypothetical protein
MWWAYSNPDPHDFDQANEESVIKNKMGSIKRYKTRQTALICRLVHFNDHKICKMLYQLICHQHVTIDPMHDTALRIK